MGPSPTPLVAVTVGDPSAGRGTQCPGEATGTTSGHSTVPARQWVTAGRAGFWIPARLRCTGASTAKRGSAVRGVSERGLWYAAG